MKSSDIHIQVQTRYLPEQSSTEDSQFAFAYTITIRNLGDQAAKLLSRHWIIKDDNGKVEEVQGSGVVGLQPLIEPGQEFVYSSGAVIATKFGTMQGSYEMQLPDGSRMETPIPAFLLSQPNSVH